MFSAFRNLTQNNPSKKLLLNFLAEMEKNLEYFYVMDQRQFITHGFLMDAWPTVKDLDIIKRQESIRVYAQSLNNFNQAYKDYKEYEIWYTSDVNHKTPDNARKLHAMKNQLDSSLKPLEAIIIKAGQSLERELLNCGFLKQ